LSDGRTAAAEASMPTSKEPTDQTQDEPVYWFVLWEAAVERGDFTAAAEAASELRRRGIRVSWTNPAREREVGHV
jgi:hypothetical protein